jgi:hypothetical protein
MYLGKDVTEVAGTSQKLLNQWLERGFVKADIPADGPGTRNEFSAATICQIRLFQQLNEFKFSRKQASELAFDKKIRGLFERTIKSEQIINALRPDYEGPQPVFNAAFVQDTSGVSVHLVDSGDSYWDLYSQVIRAKHVFFVNLTRIVFRVLIELEKVE